MTDYRTKIGYPDRAGRSTITDRETRRTLGYVREVLVGNYPSGRRWFAEDARGMPIEGTYRTKRAAAAAVADR